MPRADPIGDHPSFYMPTYYVTPDVWLLFDDVWILCKIEAGKQFNVSVRDTQDKAKLAWTKSVAEKDLARYIKDFKDGLLTKTS